ncbi:MAG: SRPBCC family protein [Chloroflexota bacterium]
MLIQQSFEVAAPVERVWEAFLDVPAVASCLPGAQLVDVLGDDRYRGRVTVKLGPMSFSFEGEASVTVDPVTRSGVIEGKGTDRKGGSRGAVRVRYVLTPAGPDAGAPEATGAAERALVSLDTDLTLAGPAAQFGRTGLIEEVSKRLLAEFASCLGARLAAATPEEAAAIRAADVGAGSLLVGAMAERLRRGLRGGG